MSWIKVEKTDQIKFGDLLRCKNGTYSQKYMEMLGYEEYNNTRVGKVVNKDFKTLFEVMIKDEKNGEIKYAIYPCGSSGWWEIEKKV